MATGIERIEAGWERWYPTVLGVLTAVAMGAEGPHAFHLMEKAQWKWDTLYGTAFNLSAVITPFIFTFYTIFVTTESGFIGKAKKTKSYEATVRYTVSALWWGAGAIVASVPLTLITPKPAGHHDLWTYGVAIWFGLIVVSISSFVRAVRMFQIFISQQRMFRPRRVEGHVSGT